MPLDFPKSEHGPDTLEELSSGLDPREGRTASQALPLRACLCGGWVQSLRFLPPGCSRSRHPSMASLPPGRLAESFWLITMFVFPEQVGAGPAIHYPACAAAVAECTQGRTFWFLPELGRKQRGVWLEKSVQTQRQPNRHVQVRSRNTNLQMISGPQHLVHGSCDRFLSGLPSPS